MEASQQGHTGYGLVGRAHSGASQLCSVSCLTVFHWPFSLRHDSFQTQPALRCDPGGPMFSLTNGTGPNGVGGPQTYPLTVDITSSLNTGVNSSLNTALGAHGGSGLSALGGVIRLHEVAPADGAPPAGAPASLRFGANAERKADAPFARALFQVIGTQAST